MRHPSAELCFRSLDQSPRGLHSRSDVRAAVWTGGLTPNRHCYGRLYFHVVGNLYRRVWNDLCGLVRSRPSAGRSPRWRCRHRILGPGRYVVDHVDGFRTVPDQDSGHLLHSAADPARHSRRDGRYARSASRNCLFHYPHRRANDHYVLCGLLPGARHWPRHLAARVHGKERGRGQMGRGDIGGLLHPYAFAGALIGMCAKVLLPDIEVCDNVYPTIVEYALPVGISGLVMAAALSAIMSTSSGALIATATVVKEDIVEKLTGRTASPETSHEQRHEVRHSRIYILVFGILMVAAACFVRGVVEALTIAYDILVGGLMVAIIGGFLWPRGTLKGALASIIVGTALTLGTMWAGGDVYANEPIFAGIGGSLLVYVIVSLMTPATPAAIRDEWNRRIKTKREEQASAA